MPVVTKTKSGVLTARQREGRAVNAVAELLRKSLTVANIYLEPRSRDLSADVLAVDRAGSGDLHGVEIKLEGDFAGPRFKNPTSPESLNQNKERWLQQFRRRVEETRKHVMSLPAHFRYLAIPDSARDLVLGELGPSLYSPDGIGRIGIIAISDQGDGVPKAEIVIAPERFRVDAAKLSRIEKNLINNKKVRPDIEVRI
jgi:hypothetical protein